MNYENTFPDLDMAIANGKYPNLDSLIVKHGNRTLYEYYFNNGIDSLHDVRSTMKSITSILLGIAIDHGYIKHIDDHVYHYLPAGVNWDLPKKKISVRHLLQMTSGLDCEEFFNTKDCECKMEKTNDWIQFCLDVPLVVNPGQVWSYSSCNTLILGAAISNASRLPLQTFAKYYLFDPLNIKDYEWTFDPSGQEMSAGSFQMTSWDMCKIGHLIVEDGSYNGKVLVSRNYLKLATTKSTLISNFSFIEDEFFSVKLENRCYYGFYWYIQTIIVNNKVYELLFSSGNGGQYILVIKAINVVVVCTQSNYDSKKDKQFFDLLIRYILPNIPSPTI